MCSINAYAFPRYAFLDPYEQLLKKHVKPYEKNNIKGSGIDYLAWQSDPLHEKALELLLKTDISQINTKEEKISFWVNAYNLLTIDLIVKKGERESIHNLGGLVGDPWNEFSWVIDGLEYTLGQIHHQNLRLIGEPRIHFALTCAAVSCPDLKAEPYWSEKIYSQLEKQTDLFMKNTGKGAKIIQPEQGKSHIKKKRKFKVSQTFQWFKNDFDRGQIERFTARYVPLKGAEFDGYLTHDWTLNALKGREPEPRKYTTKEVDVDGIYE
tara:strand:- start:263506 stop:264306 length:801 start_codon:yes stop_codon:yes gene_type:complete